MYMLWHVDKYKITFKLVINWTNEILQHIVVSSGLSLPGIIDARARYRAAARRLRNTALYNGRSKRFRRDQLFQVPEIKQLCYFSIYRVIQEESAILWEMILCVILSKKVHMNMGPILNGCRDMLKRRYGPSCEHEQQLRNK